MYGNLGTGDFFAFVVIIWFFFICGNQCYTCIGIRFFIFLQENDDTVTVERVVSVGEEDCIKTETEERCIQLVRTVKSEEEVSDLCWCVLW
jgi:hypothetical protein